MPTGRAPCRSSAAIDRSKNGDPPSSGLIGRHGLAGLQIAPGLGILVFWALFLTSVGWSRDR